jgi:hypothetical protein
VGVSGRGPRAFQLGGHRPVLDEPGQLQVAGREHPVPAQPPVQPYGLGQQRQPYGAPVDAADQHGEAETQ